MRIDILDTPNWQISMQGCRLSYYSQRNSDSTRDVLGDNDRVLLEKLIKAGNSHSKVMRTLNITLSIYAPLYMWKQIDTYKVGTTTLSTSTMHTLHKIDSFEQTHFATHIPPVILYLLNDYLQYFKRTRDKTIWQRLIGLLPSSYMQLRYWYGNYQVLRTIVEQRHSHKLDCWQEFCNQVEEKVPYSYLLNL